MTAPPRQAALEEIYTAVKDETGALRDALEAKKKEVTSMWRTGFAFILAGCTALHCTALTGDCGGAVRTGRSLPGQG